MILWNSGRPATPNTPAGLLLILAGKAIYIFLPLLTIPRCADIGTDSIYLVAITLFATACLSNALHLRG